TCTVGANCSPAQPVAYVPFIDFTSGSYAATEGDSYYHSLQTSIEKHYSNGLNLLGTYTWSRCRSDSGDLLNGGSIGYRAPYLPKFGSDSDYSACDFGIRQVMHCSVGYELPFGNGEAHFSGVTGVANQLVGCWSTQWIATIDCVQPMTIECATGTTSGLG